MNQLYKFFEELEEDEDEGEVGNFPEPGYAQGILKLLPAMFPGLQIQNLKEPEFDDEDSLENWYADRGQRLFHFRAKLAKLFTGVPEGFLALIPVDAELDVRVISDDAHNRTYYEITSFAWGNHVLIDYGVVYENGKYTLHKVGHKEVSKDIPV
jgi:hypothetical protein